MKACSTVRDRWAARNQGTKPDGKPNYRIPRVSLIVYYKKSFV